MSNLDKTKPAGGQTIRLPGSDRGVALHDQLYRYAEDLQQVLERNGELESHYEALLESSNRLLEGRNEYQELINNSRDIHIVTDDLGKVVQTNPASAALAPEEKLINTMLENWVIASHRTNFSALLVNAVENKKIHEGDVELHWRSLSKEKSILMTLAQVLPIAHEGEIQHLHWVLRDVTPLRESEFDNKISSMVLNNALEGVMITDIKGVILAVNPAFCRITGYNSDEVIGQSPSILRSGKQDEDFYKEFWKTLKEKEMWQGKIFNRKKNGEVYPEWLSVSPARDSEGRIVTYIGVFSDLTKLLTVENQLAHLAYHDSLTGLPNRLLLEDRLRQAFAFAHRSETKFTVIFMDLDNFKIINDTHGHQVGDEVLKTVALRLQSEMRDIDTVARMGGDEFILVLPALATAESIGVICQRIITAVAQPMIVKGELITIGASLGCAEYPRHGDNEVTLLKMADEAMYQAKALGGNRYLIHADIEPAAEKEIAL
ncbi:MAG: diguanylate cyclase [Gallionellaceae bacterium]